MQNATAMLYCPNPACQTPNPETHKFCHKCRTALMHQYLWAIGDSAANCRPGELLGDRYLCKSARIFLDTKPGLFSTSALELPEGFHAYLRLSPYRVHVPQVYDWVLSETAVPQPILLLDQAPLYALDMLPGQAEPTTATGAVEVRLLPTLIEMWQTAAPLRQLNWLWQVANLWQPLNAERAASTLLEPTLLRVEGPLLRLLELRIDPPGTAAESLSSLGQFWSQWTTTAQPEIAPFLQQLCQQLQQGQIHNSELLVRALDEAIAQTGQAQTRQIQIATYSDQGPTRQRNEDAAYPVSGTVQTATGFPLVIVCDGIGGHQGGDVASNLAIATVEERVKAIDPEQLDPVALSVELEKAICVANDQISQRNDSEQRYDRQRMGTTLVMGLVRHHELYIAHVGDSRAYWITRQGCHQITLDDDVASREVRLGYSFYRQALQQPSSGSLVQALGMGASSMLYPTVQRFILDEDSVFLLCSDGLSDNDRVEEYWETEILPLLDGKADLSTVSRRLIEIGNTRNGYDNVTVGLIYCRVASAQSVPVLPVSNVDRLSSETQATTIAAPSLATTPAAASGVRGDQPSDPDPEVGTTLKTQVLSPQTPKPNLLSLLLGIVVLLGIGGLIAALLIPSLGERLNPLPNQSDPSSSPTPQPSSVSPTPAVPPTLEAGAIVQVSRSPATTTANPLVLLSRPEPNEPAAPGVTDATPVVLGTLPVGSIVEIVSKQGAAQQDRWVQLRVCSTPQGASPEAPPPQSPPLPQSPNPQSATPGAPPPVAEAPTPLTPPALAQPGQQGWMRESTLLPLVTVNPDPATAQLGVCQPAALHSLSGEEGVSGALLAEGAIESSLSSARKSN